MCERWRGSFEEFIKDVGFRPSALHTMDRINNDGDYCPENCRWATRLEQARNSRQCRMLTLNGVTRMMKDWTDAFGISYDLLRGRLKRGWSMEDALTKPARKMRR